MKDENSGPRVAESFEIYQATMTMLSIFTGFVFSALLQILFGPEHLDSGKKIVVRVLIVALILFLVAIFSFHHSAHRMVRYWNIVLPSSVFVRVGGIGLIGGFMSMLFALGFVLWGRTMLWEAVIVGISSVGLGGYAMQSRRMHQPKAAYILDVDNVP